MTDRTDDFRLIAAALPPQPRRASSHAPKVREKVRVVLSYALPRHPADAGAAATMVKGEGCRCCAVMFGFA